MKTSALSCSLALLISYGCQAMEQIPAQFFVKEGDQLHTVKRHDVSPFLRNLSPQQLSKFSAMGNRIKAIKLSNGDFRLEERGELLGGGPGFGAFLYVVINTASAAAAAAVAPICPPLTPIIAVGGHIVATAAAIAATGTPTP